MKWEKKNEKEEKQKALTRAHLIKAEKGKQLYDLEGGKTRVNMREEARSLFAERNGKVEGGLSKQLARNFFCSVQTGYTHDNHLLSLRKVSVCQEEKERDLSRQ